MAQLASLAYYCSTRTIFATIRSDTPATSPNIAVRQRSASLQSLTYVPHINKSKFIHNMVTAVAVLKGDSQVSTFHRMLEGERAEWLSLLYALLSALDARHWLI